MALSAAGFSTMAIFVKKLSPVIPQFELVFFRSFLNFGILLVWMLAVREPVRIPARAAGRQRRLLYFRAFAGFCGVSCLFYSLRHLPLPVAMLLGWSSPIFVLFFSSIFTGERIGARNLAFVAAAFCGLGLLLFEPGSARMVEGLSWFGVLIALFGAAWSGAAYVAVRAATGVFGVNLIILYFTGISSLLALPLALQTWVLPPASSLMELTGLGICSTLGQVAMTHAYRFAPAGKVSTMSLLNAVFSAVLGALLFDERLGGAQIIGMFVLAGSIGALTWWGSRGTSPNRVHPASS